MTMYPQRQVATPTIMSRPRPAAPARKVPDPVDVETGQRIKARRNAVGMSQEVLGLACGPNGVTLQQIQKYEKGTNRVSASRLTQIAKTLGCTAADLLPPEDGAPDPLGPAATMKADDIALATAFAGLSPRQKRALANYARSMADEAA